MMTLLNLLSGLGETGQCYQRQFYHQQIVGLFGRHRLSTLSVAATMMASVTIRFNQLCAFEAERFEPEAAAS